MNKVKAKIEKIEKEQNDNGDVLLKIFLLSNGKTYEFAARAEDYADERKRKSLNKMFIKNIKEHQIRDARTPEEKTKTETDINALIHTEVCEEEYV